MHPDQSNSRIIRNYVMMPDKAQFTANDVANATGVNINTVRNALCVMSKNSEIVKASRVNGRQYYRLPYEDEKLMNELKTKTVAEIAAHLGVSREAVYQKLRKMGDVSKMRKVSLVPGPNRDIDVYILRRYSFKVLPEEIKKRLQKAGYLQEVQGEYILTAKGMEVINGQER